MKKNNTKAGRPSKFNNPEEVRKKGMVYIRKCQKEEKPITVTGLCLELGITRETLMNYERRDEFFDTIKRLKLFVENYAEENLFNSNGRSVVGAIFSLKNFGWTDKMEINQVNRGYSETLEEREKRRLKFRKIIDKHAEEERRRGEEDKIKIKEKFGDIKFGNRNNL